MINKIKKYFTQAYSVLNMFLLLFQSVAPAAFFVAPAYAAPELAESEVIVSDVMLDFDSQTNEFELSGFTTGEVEYLLTYSNSQTDEPEQAITGTIANNGEFSETVYAGTCSTEVCTPHELTNGVLHFTDTDYSAEFTVSDDVVWLVADTSASVARVSEGVTYVAPQNDAVSVTFTRLPEEPGSLQITEITLTDQQVEQLGAVSNIAYDITSSMENGTFEYDLTLPRPENTDSELQVVHAESSDDLDSAQTVEAVEVSETVSVRGLDHFTVFVVTSPTPPADVWTVIDNGDPSFSTVGTWNSQSKGYDGDLVWLDHPLPSGAEANWGITDAVLPGAGSYEVFVHWTVNEVNRSSGVQYDLLDGDGFIKTLGTVNQKFAADGTSIANGENSGWKSLGVHELEPGMIVQINSDNAVNDGDVVADAVRIQSTEAPSVVWVDDDWVGNSDGDEVQADKIIGWNAFSTIQEAVDAVNEDGTVHVYDGTYQEQVIVDKNLEIIGQSKNSVHVVSPDTISVSYTTSSGSDNYPIVYVHNNAEVSISNLTVDGAGKGNSNYRFIGISYFNASGNIDEIIVSNITDSPISGKQHGIGVYVYSDDDTTRTVSVTNSIVNEYQKNGVVFHGNNLTGIVNNNTITGLGPVDLGLAAQNGIQFSGGVTGTISNNIISDNKYNPGTWAATGILLSGAGDGIQIINNEVFNSGPYPVYINATGDNLTIKDNHFFDNTGAGLLLWGSSYEDSEISGNRIEGNDYGLMLDSVLDSSVLIFNNSFNNPINGYDYSSFFWDDSVSQGNSWSDYTGFDLDGDNIGEVPYEIDDDSSDRYPLADLLSAQVNSVNLNKSNFKAGDTLSITVEVFNDGEINIDPSHESLVVNIKGPSGWISGSFRESQAVDLVVGETKTYEFYTSSQVIPADWDESEYTVYTSIYSNREPSLGYLPGGQSSDTKFFVDNTRPDVPTGLRWLLATDHSQEFACGDVSQIVLMHPDWDDNTESDFSHYEYTSFNAPSGSVGIDERRFDESIFEYNGSWLPGNGTYGFTVRAVDFAGNKSAWALGGTESFSDSCQITYDSEVGTPTITAPSNGEYFNINTIRAEWTEVLDDAGIEKYEIMYEYLVGGTPTTAYREVSGTQLYRDQSLSGSVQGDFTIKVRAYDDVGNVGDWSEPVTYTYDTVDPSSTITTFDLPDGGEVETSEFDGLIEGTATDATSGVAEVNLEIMYTPFGSSDSQYWNGTAWQDDQIMVLANGTTDWDYQITESEVEDGIYDVTSHATDNAGNVEETYTIKIVYDKTIPEVLISLDPASPDGGNGWYRFSNPSITLTANDNYDVENIEYQWNSTSDSGWVTYTGPFNPPGEGQNILYYRSIDSVGNESETGVTDVKYDETQPEGTPLNVRVENIQSETADGLWDEPEDTSDVNEYFLSWEHEDGVEFSKTVSSSTFESELDGLFDGVWTFKVFAVDAAGNRSDSASVNFRVGPEPANDSDGEVAGATTDDTLLTGTGFGGVLGQTTGSQSGENTQEDTQESDEETQNTDSNSDEATDGSVLGDSTCSTWLYYLPLILLFMQFAGIVGIQLVRKDQGMGKLIVTAVVTAIVIALYYWLGDSACFADTSWLSFLSKWFAGLAVVTAVVSILVTYSFLE